MTNDSAWCCTGTGFENHAQYGNSIYWHDADGLFVNLFIPSELTWRAKVVTVRQETRYPEEESTRLTFRCAQPVPMALCIRYPAWAQRGMTIRPVTDWVKKVSGKPLTFRTKGVGKPAAVPLVAFYALTPQRYGIYWDLRPPAP